MELLTPCAVPRGGFLYTMIVLGGGFLLPSSRVPRVCPGGGGWLWMRLMPAKVIQFGTVWFQGGNVPVSTR